MLCRRKSERMAYGETWFGEVDSSDLTHLNQLRLKLLRIKGRSLRIRSCLWVFGVILDCTTSIKAQTNNKELTNG